MDKFQEMRVFARVIEEGSFVGAANQLGLSKAAISRYVSELEQRLAVRLIHRTTRRLSLTQEGEIFLARCREILSRIEESEAEIATQSDVATGLLKVNIPVSFGIKHMASLWGEFMGAHPNVTLDIQLTDRVTDIVEEGVDLAIRIARLPDSSLVSRKLASTSLILCASPVYIANHGEPQQPADLAQHQTLSYSLSATGTQWSFNGPEGFESVKVQPRLWSNNGDTCVGAAIAGNGIVLQPSFLVAEALANKHLVPLLPAYKGPTLDIYAVYPTRRFLLPKVRALIEFLSDRLKNQPWSDPSLGNKATLRR